ncbi:MAG: hypothetical protein LBQ66_14110 [Planctomycetaceae bacterium]|jgi:hypothetical protein|nr:hypothetical protein [Planctomycetaceae bacterium]
MSILPSKSNINNRGIIFLGVMLFCVLSISYYAVFAQPTYIVPEPYKDLDDRIKQFFDEIIANPINVTTFDSILPPQTSGGGSSIDTSVSEMRTKLDDVKTRFGGFRDYEKIDAKPIGKDLVIIRYLLKCDSYPIVWTFTFYRHPSVAASITTSTPTAAQWQTIGLRFDTNIDILILK